MADNIKLYLIEIAWEGFWHSVGTAGGLLWAELWNIMFREKRDFLSG